MLCGRLPKMKTKNKKRELWTVCLTLLLFCLPVLVGLSLSFSFVTVQIVSLVSSRPCLTISAAYSYHSFTFSLSFNLHFVHRSFFEVQSFVFGFFLFRVLPLLVYVRHLYLFSSFRAFRLVYSFYSNSFVTQINMQSIFSASSLLLQIFSCQSPNIPFPST
jgi:hypothetical protein